jgi:hypothetical protein
MTRIASLSAVAVLLVGGSAAAQYNKAAGQSAPSVMQEVEVLDEESGRRVKKQVQRRPQSDRFGNAQGTQFDLAVDGAFEGQTVAVIQLYPFDFSQARAALKQKGFGVYRWNNKPPSPKELREKLTKACQLWIIATDAQLLNDEHIEVIKEFFDSGRGVYIWGDNEPYYTDANVVGQALLGATMKGDLHGDKVVGLQKTRKGPGILPNHLLSTGLENVYEGITIATIQPNQTLKPLIYGSAGNLVAAFYDRNGKRAILDGGFTRLYNKWDTAGTPRYVKNAAAWLVNVERFGDDVVGKKD